MPWRPRRSQTGGGRGEVAHVPHALIGRRPLERVEESVLADRHTAVEGVLRAGGERGGRRLEVVPHAALPEPGEHRQPARGEHAVEHVDARGVELENGQHVGIAPGQVRKGCRRDRRTAGGGAGARGVDDLHDRQTVGRGAEAVAAPAAGHGDELGRARPRAWTMRGWVAPGSRPRMLSTVPAASMARDQPVVACRGPRCAPGRCRRFVRSAGRRPAGVGRARPPGRVGSRVRARGRGRPSDPAGPVDEVRAEIQQRVVVHLDRAPALAAVRDLELELELGASCRSASARTRAAPGSKRRLNAIHGGRSSAAIAAAPAPSGAGGFSRSVGTPVCDATSRRPRGCPPGVAMTSASGDPRPGAP